MGKSHHHRFYTNFEIARHIIKHIHKMTAIKPTSIKQIELIYDNGTKLIVAEQKTPIIGKLFFEAIGNKEVHWEIVERGFWLGSIFRRIQSFFQL